MNQDVKRCPRLRRHRPAFRAAPVLAAVFACNAARAADIKVLDGVFEPMAIGARTGPIGSVRTAGNRTYLLDIDNHRIVIVDDKGSRTVGGIGNGKAEFYSIGEFAVSGNAWMAVGDYGNKRIQILHADGRYVREFPSAPKSVGLAIGKEGEVYLGQPQLGGLISVYDSQGTRIRTFGQLGRPPTCPRLTGGVPDLVMGLAWNRVRMTIDGEGNVWAAHVSAPILYKFAPTGKQLLRMNLDVPALADIARAPWCDPRGEDDWREANYDGIQVNILNEDITYDALRNEIVLLMANCRIASFNPAGQLKYVINGKKTWGRFMLSAACAGNAILGADLATASLYRMYHPVR